MLLSLFHGAQVTHRRQRRPSFLDDACERLSLGNLLNEPDLSAVYLNVQWMREILGVDRGFLVRIRGAYVRTSATERASQRCNDDQIIFGAAQEKMSFWSACWKCI